MRKKKTVKSRKNLKKWYADESEMLVIRRSLHPGLNQEETWLRDNIFHSRCTSHGKVCNLIVDSGSCTNAVSE